MTYLKNILIDKYSIMDWGKTSHSDVDRFLRFYDSNAYFQ